MSSDEPVLVGSVGFLVMSFIALALQSFITFLQDFLSLSNVWLKVSASVLLLDEVSVMTTGLDNDRL